MLKITPGVTACRLNIQLGKDDTGCIADVASTYTSLGPAGDELGGRVHSGALSKVHAGLGGGPEPFSNYRPLASR
jgi:hypothetical protein